MLPQKWEEVLAGPAVVLNIDRAIDRMPVIMGRIEAAGFTGAKRVAAVDGKKENMRALWSALSSLGPGRVAYKFDSDGQAACTISHTRLWRDMIADGTPFMTIFEDDVLFHKDWAELAPQYYDKTEKNIDIMYLGSQGAGTPKDPMVTSKPVFCTQAYVVTQRGAQKLYMMMRQATEVYIIDCMIMNILMCRAGQLRWRTWNGTIHADPARHNGHECRNDGLVYQDSSFETNIHCKNDDLPPVDAIVYYPQWKAGVARFLPR